MADDKVRYVLDVDDKGSPKLVKFGTVADASGKKAAKSFKGASDAISEVGQRIPGVGAAMDAMSKGPLVGAGIAVAGLAAGFGAMVMHSINTADNLNDLSLRLGITTERLSVLSLYADQSGTDINTLAGAMGKLGNKIASGDKDLKRYGVTAGTTDEALFQLADKIAATEDPMMRLKIATDAFGKSGQEMLPLLVQGGAALREMSTQAPIVSTEMARMADDFNDRMAVMKGQFVGIGLGIAESVLPQLIAWADGVDRIRQAVGLLNSEEKRTAGRNEIVEKYGKAMTGSRTRSVDGVTRIGGKSLREALAEYDAANAKPVEKPKSAADYVPPDAPKKANDQEKAFEAWRDGIRKKRNDELTEGYKARMDAIQEEADFEAGVEARLTEFKSGLAADFRAEQEQLDSEALALESETEKAALDARFAMQMSYANQMEGVLSSAFYNSMVNGENLWNSLGEGFANMLAQMAAQMAARAAIFGLFNAFTGGGFGLAAGGFSSFVFRAGGGPYSQGDRLITQERRAEAIIPRGPGRVAPTSKGGDTITIVVQNPTQAVSVRRQLTKSDRRRDTGIR